MRLLKAAAKEAAEARLQAAEKQAARIQAGEERASRLQDELAASQTSCGRLTEQLDSLRTERDESAHQVRALTGHIERLRQALRMCGVSLD